MFPSRPQPGSGPAVAAEGAVPPRQIVRAAAILTLAAALTIFIQRTAFQFYTPCDFAVLYVAAHQWAAGEDPYADSGAAAIWKKAGGRRDVIGPEVRQIYGKDWLDILLIPPALPLLAPLALLPAPAATAVWWAISAALFVGAWLALTALAGVKPADPIGLMILAISLLLAPLHEAFGYGQPSLPSFGLIVISAWLALRRRHVAAGALLALASALKPQLGGVFVLYYLFTGRWRIVATATAVIVLLSAVAIVPMSARGIPWLTDWLANLQAAEAVGGMNSPSPENVSRSHMLNLQIILHGLIGDRIAVNLLALAVTGALAGLFAWSRTRRYRGELHSLAVVSVLALMPIYHRFYDGVLMMIPLGWAVANLRARPRAATAVLLFALTFLIPDQALARIVRALGGDMSSNSGLIWDVVIEPWRAWIMLTGFFLLLWMPSADEEAERSTFNDAEQIRRFCRKRGYQTSSTGGYDPETATSGHPAGWAAKLMQPATEQNRSTLWIAVALTAVLLGTCALLVRTAMQQHYKPCDFAMYYASSRAWVQGVDPYDRVQLPGVWISAGGRPDIMLDEIAQSSEGWMPVIQLPPTLSLLAPLSLLPAPLAVATWYAICIALLLAQSAALASMMGSSLARPAGLFLLAGTLLLAPVHENFGWAQLSTPAISLIILAAWAAMRQRELACGILLALSTALKPQLGGVFFLYYLFTLGRRFGYGFVAVLGLLSAVALLRMEVHGTSWISGWLENMRLAEAPGGMNSTSTENPDRSYLLHLPVILHGLFDSRLVVNALAALITLVLAGAFVWNRHRMRSRDELLCVSAVSILTLLPVYHRFYDAALLVVPLAWSIAHLRARPREAWPLLLLVATFVIPYAAVRRMASLFGGDLATASGAVWDLVIEPARVWILLAGFACILLAMRPRTPALQKARTRPVESWLAAARSQLARVAASRSALVPCAWMLALIVAVLFDGAILTILQPYAAAVRASYATHELKEVGHLVFVLLLAGFVGILHPLRWRAASLLVWSAVVAKVCYAITKASMVRPRPSVTISPFYVPGLEEITSRLARVHEFFWPSGHTITAFAAAAAMGFLLPRGRWVFFGVATLVGLVRIAELAHYPSEIVAYAALGVLSFYVVRKFHEMVGAVEPLPDICAD